MIGEWQPIETAPRDGSIFVVLAPCIDSPDATYYDGQVRIWTRQWIVNDYDKNGAWWDNWKASIAPKPTHWMPLPAPPPYIVRDCVYEGGPGVLMVNDK